MVSIGSHLPVCSLRFLVPFLFLYSYVNTPFPGGDDKREEERKVKIEVDMTSEREGVRERGGKGWEGVGVERG
jgi:hypothetical protein